MVRILLLMFILMIHKFSSAQTNPAPQTLPYNQDFSGMLHGSITYPMGWNGWSVGTSTGTSFSTTSPIADRVLMANSSASTNTGNIHNYKGKLGMLSTSSLDLGIVLALNTSGKKNILFNYDVMTLRNPYDSVSNTKIREVSLQYRTDTFGPFINLTGIEYRNNTIKQNGSGVTTPQNLLPKSVVLPPDCDNIPRLQLRWITRDVSGTGLRPSFAIDNVKVDTASVLFMTFGNHAFEDIVPTSGSLNIALSASLPITTSFEYSISGSASLGTDYSATTSGSASPTFLTATSGTISLPAGTSVVSLNFLPINDATIEGMETITFRITKAPSGFAIKDSTVLIKIVDDEPTPVSMIQGAGLIAQSATCYIEGIVTGVFPLLSPGGFYLQEEDSDADSDSNTSEGIFVVTDSLMSIGDKVKVLGETYEGILAPSYNQACINVSEMKLISKDNPMPSALPIRLPLKNKSDMEAYEGMLVYFKDTLTVTDNSNLGKYGEITIAQGGPVYQPSQMIDPNDIVATGVKASGIFNLAAIDSIKRQSYLRSILLDDGKASSMSFLPYVDADNTLRLGSTLDSLWGIMTYGFNEYRIQPVSVANVKINHQPRPVVPDVGPVANIRVASFNVLNYFNGDGLGGGFPTSRGAHSIAEFTRQRDKIIRAIIELDADILGLIEIENDGTGINSAIQNLVNGVNAYLGEGTYSVVNDGAIAQKNNSDEIRCGIIYKSKVLDTVGGAMLASDTIFNRPPLAQTFRVRTSDSVFNFVINHFKSKTCTDSKAADKDQEDGQGCFNDTRKKQAAALVAFINNQMIPVSKNPKVLSMGDYNSYFEEDPLDTMRSYGLIVLNDAHDFSYSYQGQLGSLDNAVVSKELLPFVGGVKKWNINSVEPAYLDYEDDVDDGGSDLTNFWSFLYSDVPFRCSDHDPVLVGLNLGEKVSVEESNSSNEIKVYPNPSKDYLIVSSDSKYISSIKVFSAFGQIVSNLELPNPALKINLDVQQYHQGFYLLRVTTTDGTQSTRRFVKL